jgi:hypothetical protein
MNDIKRYDIDNKGRLVESQCGTLVFFEDVEKFYTKRRERKKKEDNWDDCGIMSHLARDW